MDIKLIASGIGLVGVINVVQNRGFTVADDRTDEDLREPIKKCLKGIISQKRLPLWVPSISNNVSAVAYYKKGDALYPYAVADEFSRNRISNLILRGEVVAH